MTITIAEKPILVDVDGEAQSWLDRYFCPHETFVDTSPETLDNEMSGHANASGHFFQNDWPELPTLTVNQLQWPCVGVSRFARALFLVDRYSLDAILDVAWGLTDPGGGVDHLLWTQTTNIQVDVYFPAFDGESPKVTLNLYALQPLRVSDDLWILPMVDERYMRRSQLAGFTDWDSHKPATTWEALFSNFSSLDYQVTIADTYISHPDTCFAATTVPVPYLIDSACLSLGSRPVVLMDPLATKVKFSCEIPAAASGKRITLFEKPRITGGPSLPVTSISSLEVRTRQPKMYYSGNGETFTYQSAQPGEGNNAFCKSTFVVLENGAEIDYAAPFRSYVDAIGTRFTDWTSQQHAITLPGFADIVPSGFDDLIIYDGEKGQTIVRSLPRDWFPKYLLAQHVIGEGSKYADCLWFHTPLQTVMALSIEAIPIGGTGEDQLLKNSVGEFQLMDHALALSTSGAFRKAIVQALNPELWKIPSGTVVQLTWARCKLTGDVDYEGWIASSQAPPDCSEKLERFTMLSGWYGTECAASFKLITSSGSPDRYGLLEDPEGIFTDQIDYGNTGLSIRTCSGRHFVTQAKCNQTPVTPATTGKCVFGSPGNPDCAVTTEANCTLLGGTWTSGGTCP